MSVTNEDVEAACGAFFGGQAWTEFMPEKHKQGHRDQMLIALRSVEAARVAARGCAIEIEIKIGMDPPPTVVLFINGDPVDFPPMQARNFGNDLIRAAAAAEAAAAENHGETVQ